MSFPRSLSLPTRFNGARRRSPGGRSVAWWPLVLACGASALSMPPASAQFLDPDLWLTDGTVHVVTLSGSTIYLGGEFTRVSPVVGGSAVLDAGSGAPLEPYARINGQVNAVVGDGAGGWYIGGGFTLVRGMPRENLAHLDAAGDVTAWNPGANGLVRALAYSGSRVYVGGDFDQLGGQSRTYVGAVDPVLGTATAWNPGADAPAFTFLLSGGLLYAGGGFSQIGGQSRSRLAALDPTTGVPTAWNPGANDVVASMSMRGGTLYVGGYFTEAGGQARSYIAGIDVAGGAATAWNPGADGPILSLATTERTTFPGTITVFAGGYFTTLGGQSRNFLGAVDGITGTPTTWDPNADNVINALVVRTSAVTGEASTIYVGGEFVNVAGEERRRIAALSPAGAATAWDPGADAAILALAISGPVVYAGGFFQGIGGQARNRIAAFDASSGAVTPWNPNADGTVRALVIDGSTVYVGGDFDNIGGQPRRSLAALDVATGQAGAWQPDPRGVQPHLPGRVHAIAVRAGTVYVAGDFYFVGGFIRTNIAALDPVSGAATSWDPGADGIVWTLATTQRTTFPNEVTVYAGGEFMNIGGLPRAHAAALNGTTGGATSWNPSADLPVRSLLVRTSGATGDATAIYAGGDFAIIGGQARDYIAVLSPAGAAGAWDPHADGPVTAMTTKDFSIAVGGSFFQIGGETRVGVAELDASTGLATAWNAGLGGSVRALAWSGSVLYVGGNYSIVSGVRRTHFAGFTDATVGAGDPVAHSSRVLLRASPNPSRGDATLEFWLPEPADAELLIVDAAGRRVRDLRLSTLPAGLARQRWDGRDDAGRAVGPGLYFVRLSATGTTGSARIVRM